MDRINATQCAAESVVGRITEKGTDKPLTAVISGGGSLSAVVGASKGIVGCVTEKGTGESLTATVTGGDRLSAAVTVPNYGSEYEIYDGEYEVTPKVVSQSLATASKVMESDVTIHEIPYYETTNESGGYTVIIG